MALAAAVVQHVQLRRACTVTGLLRFPHQDLRGLADQHSIQPQLSATVALQQKNAMIEAVADVTRHIVHFDDVTAVL